MLKLDPRYHQRVDVHFQSFLDNEFEPFSLYVIFNRSAKVFEVVRPLHSGCVAELIILDHPGDFSKEDVRRLRLMLDPSYMSSVAALHRRKERDEMEILREQEREGIDRWKYVQRNSPMLSDHPTVKARVGVH